MTIECAFFGTLGRDAESKTSKAGNPYLRINVRCGDGEAATWVNTMVFDEEAVAAVDRLIKGSSVYIEGTLKLDTWTGQDGTERHGLNCMARYCRMPAIGQHRPRKPAPAPAVPQRAAGDQARPEFDDQIPW